MNKEENLLDYFENAEHRKDVEEYVGVRKRINKIKSDNTIRSDVIALLTIDRFLPDKPFREITAKDLQDWETNLETAPRIVRYKKNGEIYTKQINLNYLPSTINAYKIKIRPFFKFLHNKEEYKRGVKIQKKLPDPPCTEWITINRESSEIPADYIPKDKDIKKMLQVCDNPRDSSLIATLYDAGLRLQEIINLNINNVSMGKHGGEIILPKRGKNQKTGTRRIFIVTAIPYLKNFINNHPFSNYPNAPLFHSRNSYTFLNCLKKVSNGRALTSEDVESLRLHRMSVGLIVADIGKKAGLRVKIYPHLLRHASATRYARLGLNESELRDRYGWAKTSSMPSKYIHLSGAEVDKKILHAYGFIADTEMKKDQEVLKSLKCPDCGTENPPTFSYCGNCRMPLKLAAIKSATQTGLDIQEIVKDPDVMMKMMNLLAEQWEKLQHKQMQGK
jgi:integrase